MHHWSCFMIPPSLSSGSLGCIPQSACLMIGVFGINTAEMSSTGKKSFTTLKQPNLDNYFWRCFLFILIS